jgi:MinD superfamily P-loop ATPase
VLVVTELGLSGEHDLERVLGLSRHFGMPCLVCLNKWEINSQMTDRIERKVLSLGAKIAGRTCYDRVVS